MAVAHLVKDFFHRMRDVYRWWGTVIVLVWALLVMVPDMSASVVIALSLSIAFMTGPFMSLGGFDRRELVVLPASRREVWIAQWIVAVLAGPAWNLAAKLAGISIAWLGPGPSIQVETLVLSVFLDVVYCGAVLGVAPALRAVRPAAILVQPLAYLPAQVLGMLVLAAGFGASLFVQDYLPTTWTDLNGPSGVAVVAALALTYAGYRHVPRIGTRSGSRSPGSRRVAPAARFAGARPGRGPTGMTLLFAREWLLAFGAIALALALYLGMEWRDGRFFEALSGIDRSLARDELPVRYAFGYIAWAGGGWFALLALSSRNALAPMMRHLRVLPASRWRANAYIVALAAPVWVSVLIVFSGIYLAATGSLPSPALGPLFAFAGMTALAHSLGLPNCRGYSVVVIGVVPVVGAVALAMAMLPSPGDVLATPMGLGLIAFLVAAWRNHVLLTRNSEMYRSAVDRMPAET